MDDNTIRLVMSSDGSHTLYKEDLNEHYHSVHGAVQESEHVFINAGLNDYLKMNNGIKSLSILEIGFGTGLNTLLTAKYLINLKQVNIVYTTLDPYPISNKIIDQLNYTHSEIEEESFRNIHGSNWNKITNISHNFQLNKLQVKLEEFKTDKTFDIIYYDAFGPNAQQEMWTIDQFIRLFDLTDLGGILVTYCAKGQVRRDLQKVGYKIERLKGPIGKREMIRASRI